MERKGLTKSILKNIPDLEEPLPIFIFTRATRIPRGLTIDVRKSSPEFMIQMNFAFFNVESIHVFTSNFGAICYANSHPFGFPPRSK